MKELTIAETEFVSGAAANGFFDTISGAIIGMVAGGMGVAWAGYNISSNTNGVTSGILAPVQGLIGGLLGAIWGAVFGLVIGAADGTAVSLIRAYAVWNNIVTAG